MEIWKEIKEAEYYMISNQGKVKSVDKTVFFKDGRKRTFKGQMKTISLNPNGYLQVTLTVNRKTVTKYIHRLVAEHFLDKHSEEMTYVNHIDGNRLNNMAENLEWCTPSENSLHSYSVLKQRKPVSPGYSYPIKAINIKESKEIIFNSVRECERELGVSKTHIFRLLKTNKVTKTGWKFVFIDVEDIEKIDVN